MSSQDAQLRLPKINEPLMGGFRIFNRRYLKKHFHAVGVNREQLAGTFTDQDTLVVYANHASWWDPLIALFLVERVFPGFGLYAPIDADAFQKYKIFGQMGFFPVDQHSLRGAADFLRIGRKMLQRPGTSLWVTPEGRFVDVRETSAKLETGIAHLAATIAGHSQRKSDAQGPRVWFVPAAVEYTFWEERLPELLVWLGTPICASASSASEQMENPRDKLAWNERITRHLRDAQQSLAAAAIARDSDKFEVMLRSKSGTFFLYDWYRSLRGRLSGKRVDVDHSDKLQ